MKTYKTLLMVVAVIGLVASVGDAALLRDDFDDGNYTGWTITTGAMTAASNYIVGTSYASTTTYDIARQGLSSSTNKFYFEFSIRCGVVAQSGSGYVKLRRESTGTGYALQLDGGANVIKFLKNNPTEYSMSTLSYNLATNVWYDFTWMYDSTDTTLGNNGSMYLYEGHGTSGTLLKSVHPNWKTTVFDQCELRDKCVTYSTSNRHHAFDDIYIDGTIPEPATMTLLLLGLPFALRRRR